MRPCILLLSFLVLGNLSAQSDVSSALWFTTPPVIDGNNTDWQRPFNLYDGSTGIMFAIANDSTSLYMCFTVNEEWKARKMLRAGWEIEVSCKEKNKKISGLVKVPGQKREENEKETRPYGWGARPDFTTFVNVYRLQFATIEAQRFLSGNGTQPFNDAAGIQLNLQADSLQGMVIEVAIPLRLLIDKSTLALNEQLQLQVTVNGLAAPPAGTNANSSDPNSGWDNSSNRGSSVIGGQPGNNDIYTRPEAGLGADGQNGPSQTTRSPLTEQASFKQKFRLTAK